MKIKNLLLLLICLAANSAVVSNIECAAAAGAGAVKAAKESIEKPTLSL